MVATAAYKGQSGRLDWFDSFNWDINGISDFYYDFLLLLILMNKTHLWYQVWFIRIQFNGQFLNSPLSKYINCFENQTELVTIIDNFMTDDTISLLCNKSLNSPQNTSATDQIMTQVSRIESNENSNDKSKTKLTDNSETGLHLPDQKALLSNIFNEMIDKYWGPEWGLSSYSKAATDELTCYNVLWTKTQTSNPEFIEKLRSPEPIWGSIKKDELVENPEFKMNDQWTTLLDSSMKCESRADRNRNIYIKDCPFEKIGVYCAVSESGLGKNWFKIIRSDSIGMTTAPFYYKSLPYLLKYYEEWVQQNKDTNNRSQSTMNQNERTQPPTEKERSNSAPTATAAQTTTTAPAATQVQTRTNKRKFKPSIIETFWNFHNEIVHEQLLHSTGMDILWGKPKETKKQSKKQILRDYYSEASNNIKKLTNALTDMREKHDDLDYYLCMLGDTLPIIMKPNDVNLDYVMVSKFMSVVLKQIREFKLLLETHVCTEQDYSQKIASYMYGMHQTAVNIQKDEDSDWGSDTTDMAIQFAFPQHLEWDNNEFKINLEQLTNNMYEWMREEMPNGRLDSKAIKSIKQVLISMYAKIDKTEKDIVDEDAKKEIDSLFEMIQKCRNNLIHKLEDTIKMEQAYVEALLNQINNTTTNTNENENDLKKVITIYNDKKGKKYLLHNLLFECWDWHLLFVSSALPIIILPFMFPWCFVYDSRLFNLRFSMFESSVVIKLMNRNLDQIDDNHPNQYIYKKLLNNSYVSICKALVAIGTYWNELDNEKEIDTFKTYLATELAQNGNDEPPKKKQKLISKH